MKSVYDYLAEYNIELTANSGKEIARTKDPFYTHTGIEIGNNRYSGERMIFHNHKESGPAIVTLTEFRRGFSCHYTNRPSDSWDVVLVRSFRQVEAGNMYAPVNYNCQHASSISRKGIRSSHGVNNTLGVLAFVFAVSLLSSSGKNN